MEKVVHHDGQFSERRAARVVIAQVGIAACLAERTDFRIQVSPIGAVAFGVDVAVQAVKFGVLFVNPAENPRLVVAAQVQVFKPDEVATVFHPLDYRAHIGNYGENRGELADGVDSRVVERLHRGKPALYARRPVHLRTEILVERVYRKGHAGVRESLDEVKVAQDEVAFCCDAELNAASF